MAVLSYDPGDVSVVYGGVTIGGLSNGVSVRVEPNADLANPYYGLQGEAARSVLRNRSYTATIRLGQVFNSNDLLAAEAELDEIAGIGLTKPFMIRDKGGRTLIAEEQAYVKRRPTVEFGEEISEREWTFELPNPFVFEGGN